MNIITGLQPTGGLHIGNFFGAIRPLVSASNNLSSDDNIFFMVANLHAITAEMNYDTYYQQVIDNLKLYIASGLDVTKTNINIFRQHTISQHAELAWCLSCFTYFGEMSRMTQFKDKSAQNATNINVGLFSYPILMAADILLYNAKYVPVGEDQRQHLELARNIAIRFNNKFKDRNGGQDIFVVPETMEKQLEYFKQDNSLRIRSLVDPTKKMSKSAVETKSKILMTDSREVIVKKVMSATTDLLGSIDFDIENQTGISNLLTILATVRNQPIATVISEFKGQDRYGDFKKVVAAEVADFVTNIQQKVSKVSEEEVMAVVKAGEERAKKIAAKTLSTVHTMLGLEKSNNKIICSTKFFQQEIAAVVKKKINILMNFGRYLPTFQKR
jgi:tryptophanyl-tRNA synthetase